MGKKYKILYVDDEESNLRIFKDTFRRDFEVLLAISGHIAIEILKHEIVDIIITDQRMPSMTGVELLAIIQKKYTNLPPKRLMISGYSNDSDIKKAFEEYNLFKFINKPWEYTELKQIIINALKQN
jgi:response regulator RpfG family c-di-GMP phosphodiesterase